MSQQPFAQIKAMAYMNRQDIEAFGKNTVKNIYIGNHLLLCQMLTKYKIYLDGRDAGVVPNILMDGFWESWITKFIAKTVQPGDFCIDAGANFGYYSLLLADLAGGEGKTIAIEPNAYLCKLLAMTNNLNSCKYIIVNKAISDVTGETILAVPVHLWGGASIVSNTTQEDSTEYSWETVKTDKLDNVVADAAFPRVDFIKMDCEGAEPMIFAGMEQILANNPQLKLVMEYSPFLYPEPEKFTEFLFSRFAIGEITGDSNLRNFTEEDIPYLVNLKDHIDLFLSPK